MRILISFGLDFEVLPETGFDKLGRWRWRRVLRTLPMRCRANDACEGLTFAAGNTILNHMVDFQASQLDRAFSALADPTRRAILDRLSRTQELSVSEIAAPFAVSLPAVMKHLDVLARADLIEREKSGRTVRCRLRAAPMETAMQWLSRYERFWTDQLDRLAAFIEEEQCSPNPVSPSNAASKRRPRKSSPPGPTRKK